MRATERNICIGGEAGQGLVTIGQLLGKALVESGYELLATQSYHSRIRGGHNTFTLRCGRLQIDAPRLMVDLLVALNQESVTLHRSELKSDSLILVDQAWQLEERNCLPVPFTELSANRFNNTVATGVVGALLGLDPELLNRLVASSLRNKEEKVVAENLAACAQGYRWGEANRPSSFAILEAGARPRPRMYVTGNEALALGALAAGLKFCAFYPMSPATAISLTVIAHADRLGCVVEQAEDEIAAINLAIGASFAGAPSMAATSGGGLALMTEGVSLAGMTETPVVVMVAQRPGPATGLPTKTEQADLEMVLHLGHGEFPRAILAPGSHEACYRLGRQAFFLAERLQSPVFVLTDQFLADSYRALTPFSPEGVNPVRVGAASAEVAAPYQRYALTASGISPRLLPGFSPHLVLADSDEHYEDGRITEEPAVRVAMVEKRLRKIEAIRADIIPPTYHGDLQPELLFVCWGSSQGAVLEVVAELRKAGGYVASLHFEQLWPLAPEQFVARLQEAQTVVVVEGNATAQFAKLIRRESGFLIPHRILRYDGFPLTPEYILKHLPVQE